jgi:hypothetical protein
MLAFSLGTLPALVSLSAVSSLATGAFQRHFLKFAGAAVIILGIGNIEYGLTLTGGAMNAASIAASNNPSTERAGAKTAAGQPDAQKAAGSEMAAQDKQIVVMRIEDFHYVPTHFTVKQGIPVEWRIDASEAAPCGRFLIAPGLGIRRILSNISTTTISFVPQASGEYGFNCGMGMMTPGKFTVVPNAKG